ncbi:MAG TPA: methyltransferase [Candidatus Saccharimonadales bacterium]|nr:methyltransferase [Candidatus Saccharimonadales bacterium]
MPINWPSSSDITEQLPIKGQASLYTGYTRQTLIRKFRKEAPEAYLAVYELLKNADFRMSGSVLVRENGFGFIPVLLALALPRKAFTVSVWSVDSLETLNTNIGVNALGNRIKVVVEGVDSNQSSDVAILVHENYQSHDTVAHEVNQLIKRSKAGIVYIITHKNKGVEKLVQTFQDTLHLRLDIIGRGNGGGRVIKVTRTQSSNADQPNALTRFFDALSQINFLSGLSLFSAGSVDKGSEMLIRYVLDTTRQNQVNKIYDLACGYGAIGLSLATKFPEAFVVLSDSNARAVDVAKRNAADGNLESRTSVILSDGTQNVRGIFDLVVSNPPLHIERRKLTEILINAGKLVKKGGRMLLVIEDSQVDVVKDLVGSRLGYLKEVKRSKDHVILEYKK